MTISLTWTDAADGTGGVATVAGADADTVEVFATAVDATGLTNPTWTSKGTRTGDGTVSVSLTPGYYWLYAAGLVSGLPALSNLVYALASDSADALASRCVDAIAARLAGLVMTIDADGGGGVTLPNATIYKQTLPEDSKLTYPCILLSHEGLTERPEGTTTGKDDIAHGCICRVLERNEATYQYRRKTWLRWRQQVFRSLRNQRLAGITEVLTVRVEPRVVIDPHLPAYQVAELGFTVWSVCRETRGV